MFRAVIGMASSTRAGEPRYDGPMRFSEVSLASANVASMSSRLQKIDRLAELLARLPTDEIEPAVAFLSGTTRQGRIGIGHAAISATFDVPAADEATLEIGDVDRALAAIAAATGKGSVRGRTAILSDVVRRATRQEQDFLRRVLYGELRQGALAGVLTDAIARAAGVPAASVRRAAMLHGDLPKVARLALQEGEPALIGAAIELMRPVQPMLAGTGEDLDQALGELGDSTLEYKLDGARIQVHKSGDLVRLFSRTLNDVTASAPEIVSAVRALPARELILDGEVIALRPDGSPYPFQMTMRRFGRTRDVPQGVSELPLTPFFFDCLFLDGQALLDDPLERRMQALDTSTGPFVVPRIVRPTAEQARAFQAKALARGHEGLMAKGLASAYAAGRRGAAWLKVKQANTLDLVVLAVEWGSGRRKGWLSNIHLGARDPETNGFVMLGKTFKGMTDEMLTWQTEQCLAREIGRDAHTVFVRPELVVEVAFNEIQDSPVYPGGLALRFARVKRYRLDKTATDADTIATVRTMAARMRGSA
jgi:DNA ligase 1